MPAIAAAKGDAPALRFFSALGPSGFFKTLTATAVPRYLAAGRERNEKGHNEKEKGLQFGTIGTNVASSLLCLCLISMTRAR